MTEIQAIQHNAAFVALALQGLVVQMTGVVTGNRRMNLLGMSVAILAWAYHLFVGLWVSISP